MQITKMLLILAAFVVNLPGAAQAQHKDFTGNWVLKERKLINGKNFDNAIAPFVTYILIGDSVKVKKAGDPANVKIIYQTTERTYLPGKKQVSVTDKQVTIQRYLNWLENKQSWELVSEGSREGQPETQAYQFRDVWTYDAAADVLRLDMAFKSTDEPDNFCTFKAVYERAQ